MSATKSEIPPAGYTVHEAFPNKKVFLVYKSNTDGTWHVMLRGTERSWPLAEVTIRPTTCCGLYEAYAFVCGHEYVQEFVQGLCSFAWQRGMSGLSFVIRYFNGDSSSVPDQCSLVTHLRSLPGWNEPERWYRNMNTDNMLKVCTLVTNEELYDEADPDYEEDDE